jgi:hypothetical protein
MYGTLLQIVNILSTKPARLNLYYIHYDVLDLL